MRSATRKAVTVVEEEVVVVVVRAAIRLRPLHRRPMCRFSNKMPQLQLALQEQRLARPMVVVVVVVVVVVERREALVVVAIIRRIGTVLGVGVRAARLAAVEEEVVAGIIGEGLLEESNLAI